MNQKEYENIRIISEVPNNTNNIIKIDKALLENDLKCPLCNILYDSNIHIPFVISCGHTFCKQCIFNNSNNKCPIDSIINAFKLYLRNIQIENIVNKIITYNKDIFNQQKMIYIKPDIKNNKIINNIEDEMNLFNKNKKEKTNRVRGKSINQRGRVSDYKINSPESSIKNYNKKLINKHFKSPNVNVLKNVNRFNDMINYNIKEENDNKLNFIEDNFKLEEEIDDMCISETIGTIPIFEEKSLTNSIREDFNDLLTKNEIYKKRIINNNTYANNKYTSPMKKKENFDINQNFFNEQNKKIILYEDQNMLTQKPLRLSNYNIRNQPNLNENRQMTEVNPINNIKPVSNIENTKTEKKKENKNYQNFYTSSINHQFNQTNRNNINNNNEMNSKNIKTIFDYIKSINKLSSNNTNGNTLNKNLSKNKEEIYDDLNNDINKNIDDNKGGNIININNYNNNLRISLQEKHLEGNEFNILKANLINSPINCQKYIKVRASSKIPKKKDNQKNNENVMSNDNEMKNINSKNNKKLKQIRVKKDSSNNINNINVYNDKNNSTNSNNSSLLYNKKKIISNKNVENNISNESLENADNQNDKIEFNNLSLKPAASNNNNIKGNINITISPKRINRKLNENRILNQKLDFARTINQSPLNRANNNNKEINNIIKVGEYLSKNKIEQSRSLSSNKNKLISKTNIINKLKKEYESLNFQNISLITKKKFDEFFQNSINGNLIFDILNTSPNIFSVILTPNNNLFIGELDQTNSQNPKKGILLSPNMDYFEGEFVTGKKEGKGKLLYNNGTEYTGNFKNNKPDGYGQLTQENGEIYQGEWKEGKINGHGTRFHKNGDKYIGNYINNIRNGYGVYIFSNGNTYEGNWIKGKANGKGIFKYNNGNIYEGEFKDNLIEGKGKLILKNGDVYEGQFVNGTIHGEGYYMNKDGEKYIGGFYNGKKEGKGVLQDKNGNVIKEGFWKMDEFIYE